MSLQGQSTRERRRFAIEDAQIATDVNISAGDAKAGDVEPNDPAFREREHGVVELAVGVEFAPAMCRQLAQQRCVTSQLGEARGRLDLRGAGDVLGRERQRRLAAGKAGPNTALGLADALSLAVTVRAHAAARGALATIENAVRRAIVVGCMLASSCVAEMRPYRPGAGDVASFFARGGIDPPSRVAARFLRSPSPSASKMLQS